MLERLANDLDATATLVEIAGGFVVTTVVAEPATDGSRYSAVDNRDLLNRGPVAWRR